MTEEEIDRIVSKAIRKRVLSADFQRAIVKSEEDFDGSSIIRVTAFFERSEVPAKELIEALHYIRSELLRHGEERFVFLNSASAQDQEAVDEDVG